MLKKFVSTVVGVSCAVAALGVSAESPTIQTTTTYSGGTAKIAVTTTVTGAASGNVYTYLAYDQAVPTVTTGDQIVYVDQQTATGTNVTFNYVTDSTDIGSNVKVGGKSAEGVAYDPVSDTIPAAPGNVSVTVDSEEAVKAVVDTEAANGTYVKVAYTAVNPVKSVTVNGVAADWFAGDGVVWVKVDALKDAQSPTVVITTEAATIEAQTLASGYLAAGNTEATTEDKSAVIALGQVTGSVAEYGIVFSTDSGFTSPQYLKALGRNDAGQFAIKLVDYASILRGDTVYAQVYYKATADGTATRIGDVYQLAVGETKDGRGTVVK